MAINDRGRRGTAGFTLLELMTVLAIISTLAAIAIPAFVKYIRKSKTSEAVLNLATIASLQKAYRIDHGVYVGAKANPAQVPQPTKAGAWRKQTGWEKIGFRPEGQLNYQYEVQLTQSGFRAIARGDLDGDGVYSSYEITEKSDLVVEREIE